MILSFAHHATPAHPFGALAATLLLAAAVATGIAASRVEPPVRVTVTPAVEVPRTAAPTPEVGAPEPATAGAGADTIGVTVPSRDEILAQCAAAGLTAECVSAGLR